MRQKEPMDSGTTPLDRIVCLGWGSLVWAGRDLPVKSAWQDDGPELPLEFARHSADGRMTLVIVQNVPPVPVLWVELDVDNLNQAVSSLAEREGVPRQHVIGRWPNKTAQQYQCEQAIAIWAHNIGVDGVVWTALPPGMKQTRGIMPKLDEIIAHFSRLDKAARERASEYVRRAPPQIETPYRSALEIIVDSPQSSET